MDTQQSQSTKKILAEIKFQEVERLLSDIGASQHSYEAIVASFGSETDSFVEELNHFIRNYQNKASDAKLVDALGARSGLVEPVVKNLIDVSRSYQKNNFGSSGSSTMKNIYDLYFMAYKTILKANLILESAVNMKSTVTGQEYQSEKKRIQYNKNTLFKRLFEDFQGTMDNLLEEDTNGFVDLTENGESRKVRFINVVQIFWEKEEVLSKTNTCTDDCPHFENRRFSGGGCDGSVRDCEHGVSLHHSEWYVRQNPQNDRIYTSYSNDDKTYGFGDHSSNNPDLFYLVLIQKNF